MAIELKIVEMTLDGLPYTCPECSAASFTLDGRGPIEALATVWGNCVHFHSWEEQLITVEDLANIKAASTGRQCAEDEDTFEIEIGGAVLAGILHPDVTVDDVKQVVTRVYWGRIVKPALRRRQRAAIRAVKRPIKTARAAVAGTASSATAAAKAAAIGAAWDWQAGGHEPDPDYQPEPINPCAACKGRGHHKIETRLHDTTRVKCSVCSGTGEID